MSLLVATAFDEPLVAIDGGWRVAETTTHYIDVLVMIYNYRVVETPKADPDTYDRFWCYVGRDLAALLRAVAAARVWVASDDPEPAGWNKNGQTGEFREQPLGAA